MQTAFCATLADDAGSTGDDGYDDKAIEEILMFVGIILEHSFPPVCIHPCA